jgi:ABC-2 type transport system ATP-binding protein
MREHTPQRDLLIADGLVKRFGELTALAGITLTVRRGEVFGLLGPNGAGKTTTLKICTGLLHPTSGSVFVDGIDVQRDPQAAKRLIGYVPDEPYLYDKLTGREFITFMGKLYGVRTDLASRVERLLAFFDLMDAANDWIGGYSHGMKQKTALCGVLVHEPRVLFLDEPTVGLDPRSARLLKDALRSLAAQGRGVILCTHILEIAQAICDRVAILDRGHIVAEGSLDQLRQTVHASSDESLEDIFLRLTGEEDEHSVARSLMAP